MAGNARLLFPWDRNKSQLWDEFKRIQKYVGIHVDCPEEHKHCLLYTSRCV